ncbi:MAG: bifunctional ornithine acetyltransferase/N-acetylglutamate synthase, partial [Pseudomonadota bacterium]
MAKDKKKSAGKRAEKLAKKRAKLVELEDEIAALSGKAPPPISPLAPKAFPKLAPIEGVRLATTAAEIKYRGRDDVLLAEIAAGSTIAGTFTRSETRAAPVLWCQERLAALAAKPSPKKLGLVVNAGNANAFTGDNGAQSVAAVMTAAGKAIGAAKGNMFMASTGVIGEPLPPEKITDRLAELSGGLAPDGFAAAASAIMTTDTFPKGAGATVELDGVPVTISGIAKGSGMIAPDMATMLVFIF